MTQLTQSYFTPHSANSQNNPDFQNVLDYIREAAQSESHKGELFERLMLTYFSEDPDYKQQFSEVWRWKDWAARRTDFDRNDIGIDIVAKQREGGYCAIQCKCYAETTRLSKPHIDSFLAASASELFTSRIIVNTGGGWGKNALRTIEPIKDKLRILNFRELESSHFKWPDLRLEAPEQLTYQQRRFNLKPHQKAALEKVMAGFKQADRGKLIMACGTGKTFTALRIAEQLAGIGGRVLYLVPSIGLLSQVMREWSEQRGIPHSYIGICSDTRAGNTAEDASILELKLPVTTNPSAISHTLKTLDTDKMSVVFCTYHSLPLVEQAQGAGGAPPFDIIFCDEAHRTTGVEQPDGQLSPFVLVHDETRIRANKRLYMTATPKIYTEAVKTKVANYKRDVFSMDDAEKYGREFYHLPFSKAVEIGELADYKVVVLGVAEGGVNAALRGETGPVSNELNVNDATKIVGCWRALQNPENKALGEDSIKPLKRVIAFTDTIKASKALVRNWNPVIERAVEHLPEEQYLEDFQCETQHVDGTEHALNRKACLDWLKGSEEGTCRILSNVRCLSEGIDVPALDAVIFITPRNSQIDIVQAVGRVMRKAKDKEFGYIVLPVAIPASQDAAAALDDNQRFANVWGVLRALRSHDDRLDAEINSIDLNKRLPDRLIFGKSGESGAGAGVPRADSDVQQLLMPMDIPISAILPKIVEKCGDKKYWENWAKDVAVIFGRLVGRIENLLENPANTALREWFDAFHTELKASINDTITRSHAIDMMAQHILTQPVFAALFEHYDFSSRNPVASALDNLQQDFAEFGLENETRDLEDFYESVRMRVRGIDNSAGRQQVLSELYEQFFKKGLKKEADRLGIAYTPIALVDFILHSVNDILQDEFGCSLSDEGVQVLDPFTGTGTFLVQLLQSELIRPDDLERKFREELHANEIVLLAYYIAAVNIEEAFRGRRGGDSNYEPFKGIVLTDTFNLNKQEAPTLLPKEWLPDNNERAERQQQLPIQVIVGNPPWSAGQKSASDDNPNVKYPALEERIRETYVEFSTETNTKPLYNTYKRAIRWASDRLQEQGVVAFVTPGSWITGRVDSAIRACWAEEFSSLYVLNLRGDVRGLRSEGEGVFGNATQSPVAITILIKNPNATHDGCRIHYHDIGDSLTREEKLEALRKAVSVKGFNDWQTITPDEHHDWIEQRSEAFAKFYPLGTKQAKADRADNAIFQLYSLGLATGRDAYLYNFSREACAENARRMTQDYLAALSELEANPELTVDEVVSRHNNLTNIKWSPELKQQLKRKKKTQFVHRYIRKVLYRPFIAMNCYVNYIFVQGKYQMDRIFPDSSSENRVICVPNISSKKPFSVLMTDTMTHLKFCEVGAQCFPRYRYLKPMDTSDAANAFPSIDGEPERIDNISDTALRNFQEHYQDDSISKDDIFYYVYGLLHAPCYREQFANDLSKMLPHIPFAPEFRTFAKAGNRLAELHLNYETGERYPNLTVEPRTRTPILFWEEKPAHFLLGKRAMRFTDKETKTTLIINEHVQLSGIPEEAHLYVVNDRTPLEWFINRYKIKQDKYSGIVTDPNGWFEHPRDLITAIERIVYVSVESAKMIESLPTQLTDE